MFSLIFGFYEQIFSKPKLNILIIGLDHAGKTTLLEKIKTKYSQTPGLPPHRIVPTIGMNLGKIQYNGAEVVFWDLGGQKRMRGIWEKYYSEASAIIFVVDASDKDRINEAFYAYNSIFENDSDLIADKPVVIYANKQDLPGAIDARLIAEQFKTQNRNNKMYSFLDNAVYNISSITGEGLDAAIVNVIDVAKEYAFQNPPAPSAL